MLDRYTWRHNSVLNGIISLLKCNLSPDFSLYSDLPGMMQGASTIPLDILTTPLKPDIVIRDHNAKHLYILELTVCFELNQEAAHERKEDKYRTLVSDIKGEGYKVFLYCVEIGSRGHITEDNIKRLRSLFHKLKMSITVSKLRSTLGKIAIVASYVIYHSKYDQNWSDPSYVKF